MNNTANSYSALGRLAEALDLFEQTLAFRRRVLPAHHPDIAVSLYNIGCSLLHSGAFLQCSSFAHEALAIKRFHFSDTHPDVQNTLKFINDISFRHGAAAAQRMPPPSCHHLRISRLVRLHGLSALALNGRQALVFGTEGNGQVPVRLVEASDEVRAALGWAKGQEKAIKVENLEAMGLAPAADGDYLCVHSESGLKVPLKLPPNLFASFSASLNPFPIQSSSSSPAFSFSSSSSSIFDAALGFGSNLFSASASLPAFSGGSSFNPFAAAAQELESAHGCLFPSAAAGDGSGGGRLRSRSSK
jgi:hypothetical protein